MFILGSGSPRRLELLAQLGIVPDDVRPPDVDETPRHAELPRAYCERITASKLTAVEAAPDDIVLCADTTVALGRRILGKPADAAEARAFLESLMGRRHRVITAIAVRRGDQAWHRTSMSSVKLKRLSEKEISGYLATGDWQGKAGAYAIQGPAAAFVSWIEGSHSAIVGLPLHETANLLQAAGMEIWR
ncbi:Maf family protein [Jannaschia aquimarina]|uniref:dTTP/UTP pyrophosphatase n=1 Tax=Jannaschia aquimarina TaxID=935700 RepID=A0A0D1EH59_9RHOB|nr:Maf family protein [Jannaschia aquimarina]KIT16216.1 Maf-like protein YhdE [Jannaschia aquimarina]SNT15998.1 septum formation protein [Jannaschia aquimarina]